MKKKNKVLATSVATIALCASLVAGGTYALFTSESEVNIAVTSGTVDVRATAGALTLYSNNEKQTGNAFANGGTATKVENEISIDRMTPMDSVNFDVKIENYSDVKVQYRTVIKAVDDTGLFEALDVTFTENNESQTFAGGIAYADWATLDAGDNNPNTPEDVSTINVNIEFPNGDNQNVYQGKSCKLAVVVEAVQANADVVNPITYENGIYYVNSEEGMMLMKGIIDSNPHGEGRELNFKLTANMDMTGYDWNVPNAGFTNIDGDNYTVSNLVCGQTERGWSGFLGYFGGGTLKNITLENVTAIGSQAGVIAGHADGGWIENVTIKGANTVAYEENAVETWGGVGALLGVSTEGLKASSNITVASGATISVAYNDILTESAYANEYAFIKDISAYVTNNGTISTTGEWWFNAYDGATLKSGLEKGFNVKMTKNIDMIADTKAPYGNDYGVWQNGGVLDGNGYTLTVEGTRNSDYRYDDYAIMTSGGTIKNLTIGENAGIDCFRGIMVMQGGGAQSGHIENLILENVTVNSEDVVYALNTGDVYEDILITVRDSKFTGYISYGNKTSVDFVNCKFYENTYYGGDVWDRMIRPYASTTFNNCAFGEDFYLDCSAYEGEKIEFTNGCTVNGVEITKENLMTLFSTEATDTFNDWKFGGKVDGEYVPIFVDGEKIEVWHRATTANELQNLLDWGFTKIKLAKDIVGDVTVTQSAGVEITIEGNNKNYAGVILVDGKSATYTTAGLTISNLKFVADSISADACIRLGDGTNATRYTCNVTVSNCTFDVNGAVGVKSYTGGDKNLTITGCTATANAHSLVQAKGIDGILVQGCFVYSKNGMNFNNSTNVTVDNCTADVKGYAVRFGEGTTADTASETYLIKNSNLKSACEESGDAVIVLRGTAAYATLTIENTTLTGTPDVTNTATGATVVR